MINRDRYLGPLLISAIAVSLILFSIWLDGLAGSIPRLGPVVAVSRSFSLLGNGLTLVSISIILLIAGRYRGSQNLSSAGAEGIYSIIAGSVAVHVLKAAFERPRAMHVEDAVQALLHNPSLFDLTGRYNSFPSGHTTVSFALAQVLSMRFPRMSPLFYSMAALVGASRVYLGSHYPTDVAAGMVLGMAAGYLSHGSSKGFAAEWKKWAFAGLLILAVFISFFKNGSFLLFDVDEAVFSEATREMLETGDFITPAYNYEPRYDKPILIYWLMAVPMWLFGATEFAARFTSASFGVLLALMTFLFVRRVKDDLSAYVSAIVLLLNIEFFVYSHSAVTDMTLTFFITGSVFAFYLGVSEGNPRWFALAWASSAFAVLTKGVIGLLFPGAIGLIHLIASRDLKKLRTALRPSCIALFLVIAAPWYAVEFHIKGREFFDAFILKHHVQRFSGVVSSHGGPVYYYLLVILAGFFPWVAFLPGAAVKAFREWRGEGGGPFVLSTVWVLFVLIFFSIAGTKLPNYIFPLFPAMAVMTGLSITEILKGEGHAGGRPLFAIMMMALLIASALLLLPSMELKADIEVSPALLYSLGAVFLLMGGLAFLGFYAPRQSIAGIAGMTVILLVYLRLYALPPVNIYLQETLYEYSRYARENRGASTIATYELNRPSIAFYSAGKTVKIEKSTTCDIPEYMKRGALIIITEEKRLQELEEFRELRVIDRSGGYALLGSSPALPPFVKRTPPLSFWEKRKWAKKNQSLTPRKSPGQGPLISRIP